MNNGLDPARLDHLDDTMRRHVERGSAVGAVWLVARDDDVHVGWSGQLDDAGRAVGRDSIFRIASMTKPILAVAALTLIEDCRLRLDDPIDELLPELADRRVVRDPSGPLDDTVPADRAITVRDLLTFRMGWGMDFRNFGNQRVLAAMAEAGVPVGPPQPAKMPPADQLLELLSPFPLEHQPGERWLYHLSAEVLSVLVARAADRPLDVVLRERVFDPLGMNDTGFFVPVESIDRFGPSYGSDPESGDRVVFDPTDGQWSSPPPFCSGGAGLVSTVDDLARFGRMLLALGTLDGVRVLSPATVRAMTTDQLTDEQRSAGGPAPDGSAGWGFGCSVLHRQVDTARSPGTYGWDGGLGTSWSNDPVERVVGVLLTNEMWESASPPAITRDFWTAAYAALGRS